ncbi:MAG: hypothetical protein QM759_05170 [Terricaulis sp.]
MRFALIATSAAAVIAIPLAAGAVSPTMTSRDFVSAVRCIAYENAVSPNADLGAAKFRLNTEATHQPQAAVAEAHQAASEIARSAFESENGAKLAQRACQPSPQRDA